MDKDGIITRHINILQKAIDKGLHSCPICNSMISIVGMDEAEYRIRYNCKAVYSCATNLKQAKEQEWELKVQCALAHEKYLKLKKAHDE